MGVLDAMLSPSRPRSWYLEPEFSIWPQACFQGLSSLGLLALPQVCTFIGLRVGQEGAGQGGITWMKLVTHTGAHKALRRAGRSEGMKQKELVCDQGGARDSRPCVVALQLRTQSIF